jgi:predicted RNase H-like HicB family nuclease
MLVPDLESGGYVAHVPTIPGCVTQGETVEEALAMAKDAADAMLAVGADHNEDIPTEPDGIVISTIDVKVPELASTAA